jgi:hypothetical protein
MPCGTSGIPGYAVRSSRHATMAWGVRSRASSSPSGDAARVGSPGDDDWTRLARTLAPVPHRFGPHTLQAARRELKTLLLNHRKMVTASDLPPIEVSLTAQAACPKVARWKAGAHAAAGSFIVCCRSHGSAGTPLSCLQGPRRSSLPPTVSSLLARRVQVSTPGWP